MLVMGIESSCDETAIALLENGRPIDSVLASQVDVHDIFGGVVPELASREHYRFIGPLFDQILQRNKISPDEISAIAVTRGPGLLGSLLVGTAFAKGLALALDIPLIGVNHLHAHLLALCIEFKPQYPAVGLLVSGGHTNLYLINSPTDFILLGATLDDAAGEIFDKLGHSLGFSYPSGKIIDDHAARGDRMAYNLPRPFLDNDSLDFSFSGLKTAAIKLARENSQTNGEFYENVCASFNYAIAETLAAKTERAIKKYPEIKQIWLAGGVAANSMIKNTLSSLASGLNKDLLVPSPALCTDNAMMIANAGYLLLKSARFHNLDLVTIPRGKTVPDDYHIKFNHQISTD